MLKGGVGGKDGVVGFNDGSGDLGSGVHIEFELALLSVVHTQSLHEEGSESRSGTSSERVEDKESLKTGALVSQFPDSVQALVNNFLSDGVVTTGVVVGGIFLKLKPVVRMCYTDTERMNRCRSV